MSTFEPWLSVWLQPLSPNIVVGFAFTTSQVDSLRYQESMQSGIYGSALKINTISLIGMPLEHPIFRFPTVCISALSTLELNLYFLRSARVFLSVFLGFLSRQQQQAQAPQKRKINKYRNKWECAFCLCGDRKHFKFLCISSLLIDGFVITFTQQPINMLPQKRIRVYIWTYVHEFLIDMRYDVRLGVIVIPTDFASARRLSSPLISQAPGIIPEALSGVSPNYRVHCLP